MSNEGLVLAPASLPQEWCLNSTSTITLYGGAAGSGKTYCLLLTALRFMQHPRATGVIFRRTSKMLTAGGSIWHEAVAMFTSIYSNLKIRHRETEIVFPNGAILKFSHMQHESNMYDHKGGQYSFVAFDEATDFSEAAVIYLLSRMRNANVKHTPQMFLTTNPDYDSFLREWIEDYYLEPVEGTPLVERSNKERYFVRVGNDMRWANDRKELEEVYGKAQGSGIMSFRFISAKVYDNKPLLENNPEYLSNLLSLPRVERLRLLEGSWYARQEAAGYWKRDWIELVDFAPINVVKRVRAWDLAFTKSSESNKNPDYTAGVLMSKDRSKVLTVEDSVRIQDRVHAVEKLIFDTAIRDGRDTLISIPQDPNAAAGAYAKDLQMRLASMGFTCRLVRPVKSKLTRFAPFGSMSEAGFVRVVKGSWNKEYFDELEIFDESGKYKDDQVDATSDCFFLLNKELQLPNISLPTFESTNEFKITY